MSMENVKKFMELVKAEESLAKRMVALKDGLQEGEFNFKNDKEFVEKKILPLAKEYGIKFSVEDFMAVASLTLSGLSNADLQKVSGGLSAKSTVMGLLSLAALMAAPSAMDAASESINIDFGVSHTASAETPDNDTVQKTADLCADVEGIISFWSRFDDRVNEQIELPFISFIRPYLYKAQQFEKGEIELSQTEQKELFYTVDCWRCAYSCFGGYSSRFGDSLSTVRRDALQCADRMAQISKKYYGDDAITREEFSNMFFNICEPFLSESLFKLQKSAVGQFVIGFDDKAIELLMQQGNSTINKKLTSDNIFALGFSAAKQKGFHPGQCRRLGDILCWAADMLEKDSSKPFSDSIARLFGTNYKDTISLDISDVLEAFPNATFAGETRSWDGTIENLYNCLKNADFDSTRIGNLDKWTTSCEKALKMMSVYNDTLQIYQIIGTSCGSGVKDYKHKAMLKTLALFAMEREGKVKKGTAKAVADPSTATVDDVKIDTALKEFVGGKK